ncbi:fibronectin, type III domain protein [Candidatus Magnetobacterium bavaricum]|uniref:Fibronectin, type III domain protein n=1 Tax=Candidatus Magnetobacterium bavaricum TaxID=29290 RepID=A0A0F3GKN5_9BACT|nr:fibronectin, type III domain protein [Candidatus Magnetobacterium bavaricum]
MRKAGVNILLAVMLIAIIGCESNDFMVELSINPDGTITHMSAHGIGQMWLRDAGTPTVDVCTGGKKDFQQAVEYVDCLNNVKYLGYTDWKLPDPSDFKRLTDLKAGYALSVGELFKRAGFKKIPLDSNDFYWSLDLGKQAYVIKTLDGALKEATLTEQHYVLPVRYIK